MTDVNVDGREKFRRAFVALFDRGERRPVKWAGEKRAPRLAPSLDPIFTKSSALPPAKALAATALKPRLMSLDLRHAQDLPRQLAGGIDATSLELGLCFLDELLDLCLQVGRDVIKTH